MEENLYQFAKFGLSSNNCSWYTVEHVIQFAFNTKGLSYHPFPDDPDGAKNSDLPISATLTKKKKSHQIFIFSNPLGYEKGKS